MRLDQEFIRLPFTFDAPRLAEEVAIFGESDWRPHPQGYPGNSALPLIAVNGDPFDDSVKGVMRATPHLRRLPYLRQVLSAFHAVWGRTRLMRIDGNGEATAHCDTNYYWARHTRVHVPIVTDPDVLFLCGDRSLHMPAGSSWIFDTWRIHNVVNPNPTRRIHLVADTVGSAAFWEQVDHGRDMGREDGAAQHVDYNPLRGVPLATEAFNQPVVMPPSEQDELAALIRSSMVGSLPEWDRAVDAFRWDWRAAFARFGESREGWPLYRALRKRLEAALDPLQGKMRLTNGVDAVEAALSLLIRPALDESAAPVRQSSRRLERPVFIVCSPRSGSSLFFETLAQSPSLLTLGGESHSVIEGIRALHPSSRRWHSNRLDASDATPDLVATLERRFVRALRDRDGRAVTRADPGPTRMLEKTPKNALRVPFLAEAFPDALFVYLYRDMRDTISSMLDAWRSEKFVTYPKLPGWEGPPWSLLLVPGWRELSGRSLAEIVAAQWSTATRYLLDDLDQLSPERWCISSYDALLHDPQREMLRLSEFLGIAWDRELASPLPLSKHTLTAPEPEKWRRNAAELEIALPLVETVAARARELFAHPPAVARSRGRDVAEPAKAPDARAASPPATPRPRDLATPPDDFSSVYTPSFPALLDGLGASLIVTTYQSGRVILVRTNDGKLNTHFRAFPSPMGVAVTGQTLSMGTKNFVWHFRNRPGAGDDGSDATFVPFASLATGDIRVHELAYAGDTLVIVNTRFSCLSTLDGLSFATLWKPRFITELVAEDRCHLNGVAIVDGRARYVTALGESNMKQGWRERKADGGIVIDIASDEIVARGLSMPHSPRVIDGRLWVLESGRGRLCVVDPRDGRVETVAEVPGFARGLAFAGPYAFIGLSQVRENVFQGTRVVEKAERNCGVWVVDTRSGAIESFLRFEGIVQEIFDVQLLPGVRWPDVLEPSNDAVGAAFPLKSEV